MKNSPDGNSGFVPIIVLAVIALAVSGAVASNVKITKNVDSNVKGILVAKGDDSGQGSDTESKTEENKQEEDAK